MVKAREKILVEATLKWVKKSNADFISEPLSFFDGRFLLFIIWHLWKTMANFPAAEDGR
jgi:hypothetical protein